MIIGIPREIAADENRVGLPPSAVLSLVRQGHQVFVERGAGAGSGFADEAFAAVGAQIVHGADEVYRRAALLVKVIAPDPSEYELLQPEQTLVALLHLAAQPPRLLETLRQGGATAIDLATIEDADGGLPVLRPMSQIAGRIVAQLAGRYLQSDHGGRGILLGGLPAVPPAEVVILGGGVVGRNAARAFVGCGARVTVLDTDYECLRELDWRFDGRLTTFVATESTLPKVLKYADVVIGAVLIPGARTPHLVTRQALGLLKDRAVVFDIAIDQGGCFESSRPTRLSDPTYVIDGITHFCAPNLPSLVARTATHALGNLALPYLAALAAEPAGEALRRDAGLRRGVNVFRGRVVHERVAAAHRCPHEPLEGLLSR